MLNGDKVTILETPAYAPELVGETGVVFDVDNNEDCSIVILLDNPKTYRVWLAKPSELSLIKE